MRGLGTRFRVPFPFLWKGVCDSIGEVKERYAGKGMKDEAADGEY
jgi:hypothetical protein